MKKKGKKIISAIVAAVLVISVFAFSACSCNIFEIKLKTLAFKEDVINMTVGESKDITTTMLDFDPVLSGNKDFTVTSSDEKIVSCQTRTIQAVAAGSAVITAVSDENPEITAQCTVEIEHVPASGVSVSLEGKRAQTVDDISSVVFTAAQIGGTDPEAQFTWFVEGVEVEGETGSTFSYTPEPAAGVYTVKVGINEHFASSEIRVFSEPASVVSASVSEDSLLEQNDDYSAVQIDASYTKPETDPEPFIEWFVNSELYIDGQKRLLFTPSGAGVYDITLKINFESVQIDGLDKVTVTAKGAAVPQNVKVSFDNIYPKIRITWDSPEEETMKFQVKIKNMKTGEENDTYTSTNAATSALFKGNSFNAGGLIDLTGAQYAVYVRSLGNNGLYGESEYSKAAVTEMLPKAALTYLNKKYYGGDYYCTDVEEYYDIYAYETAFRKGASKLTFGVYMAYTNKVSSPTLLKNAFELCIPTGSYIFTNSYGGVTKGSIFTTVIECSGTLSPNRTGELSKLNLPLGANAPHVAISPDRTVSHIFETDKRSVSASVSTSEELYRAAEDGIKPVPRSGSAAATLYTYAKGLLRQICTDGMTDVEKTHAIYDWIMWNVQYDYGATENSSIASFYKAYFLEGVLTNKDSQAVCDGMAKTFSLLCNMEGIPVLRVVGTAGPSIEGKTASQIASIKKSWGGHAWNKVFVEGAWYVVDPTWGDASAEISKKNYELALHDYFLISDNDIKYDHEYAAGNTYPETADESYNWYAITETFERNGSEMTVDRYIDVTGTALKNEINDAALYLKYLINTEDTIVSINNKQIARLYVALELMLKDNLADTAYNQLINGGYLSSALSKAGVQGAQYMFSGNLVFIYAPI